MSTQSDESTTGLLDDAMSRVSSLVRNEVDLAHAEVNENIASASVAVGMLAGAVIVALTGLNVLVAAVVAGLHGGWAALIVDVALATVAYGMAQKGTVGLKLSNLASTWTAKNVQRDAAAVKEACNDE